jgi:Kef-type K+ transport system membrane component KefB/Trk K+ transport system NAD-binding subunit
MNNIFLEISVVLVTATVVAGIMQLLRQPLIIGHIITGLLVGPYFLNLINSKETLEVFAHIGITLLLFIIGLSLNPRVVREVGKIAVITGLGQVLFTSAFGYLLGILLGFPPVTALYIAIALTFSSTIIVLKLLSDKKELGRLYGKIATGFLLVQDIIATLILIIITSLSQQKTVSELITATGLRIAALLIGFFFLTRFILPRLTNFFARSQEFLFLFAVGWGLGLAALFSLAGLSIEIGALFAGVALATSPFSYEISSRMRPLRDFFIIVFFILLGAQMQLHSLGDLLLPAAVFSFFILVGNPLIVMTLMGLMGYTKKTSFKAGLTVAQISEFSLILVVLGNRVGHLSSETISLVTMVGLVTIAASAYMIIYSDGIFRRIAPLLSIFERRDPKREKSKKENYDIVLIGYLRAGLQFASTFKGMGQRFVVVDYDPEIIDKLKQEKFNCIYGDANDSELLDELRLDAAKMVVSTISDFATNTLILQHVRQLNASCIVVLTSDEIDEASELYTQGATYVLMPHYLGSAKTVGLIEKHGFDLSAFIREQNRHLEYIREHQVPGSLSV